MIKYSVIIPTYNRADLLKNCLEALVNQTVAKDNYEVIVINDGSRDNTNIVVEAFCKNNSDLNFIYIAQENKGVSAARNRGIREAKGKIIFFTDDDCVVPKNWIETLAKCYEKYPDITGVGGWYKYSNKINNVSIYAQYTMYWFFRRYEVIADIRTQPICNNFFIWNPAGNTSNMSYRKSVLEKLGGFDEKMRIPGFDDWELKKRVLDLGRPLLYVPIFVLHDRPLSVTDIAIRIFRFGRGRYLFIQKHPDLLYHFYPSFDRCLRMMTNYFPIWRIDFQSMAFIEFLLTRIGWEFQKLYDRRI